MRKAGLALIVVTCSIGLAYLSCDKGGAKKDESKPSGEPATDGGDGSGEDTASDTASDTSTDTATEVGTVALETVNKIVALTDPVKAFPVTDESAEALAARAFDSVAIETELLDGGAQGIFLGQTTAEIKTAFGTSGSKPYCEAVNSAMKFFKEMSTPDFNLCVLRTVAPGAKSLKLGTHQVWDFKIASDQGNMTYRMKFRVDADDKGGVKAFENFTCEASGDQQLSQSGYVKQTVDAGKLKVHVRSQGDHGQGVYKIRVDMNAQLGTDGKPVGIKTIDYAEAGGDRTVHSKVKQGAVNLEAIGYETSESYEQQFIRFVELLDDNADNGVYHVTKLGYGDGATLVKSISDSGTETYTAGWSGDSLSENGDEPRIARVTGRTGELLASAGDDRDVEFAAGETYDCAGKADVVFERTFNDFKDCIAAFEIDQEGGTMCNDLAF